MTGDTGASHDLRSSGILCRGEWHFVTDIDLRSSGILCRGEWHFVTDISGTVHIFKGEA